MKIDINIHVNPVESETLSVNDLAFIELIPVGKENALSAREIAVYTSSDVRGVQARIERLRLAGVLICSCLDGKGGGYFRPANNSEVNDYLRHERKRIAARKASLKPAETFLKTGGFNGTS